MDTMRDKISNLLEDDYIGIITELSAENTLREWLSCQQLDFELRLDVLKLVAKACTCRADRQIHNKFIKMLVSLKAQFIPFLSVLLGRIRSQKIELMPSLKLIFDVILSIFQCFPVSSTNFIDIILPQLQMILKELPEKGKKELTVDIAELLQEREAILSQENSTHDETKCKMTEPPPPCDFRNIDLLPNKEEIESQVRPYLRANVVNGTYENVDHYLDVQFRLMREDMFRYLRESVTEYKSVKFSRESSALLDNGHIYFNAQILSRKYINGIFLVTYVYIGKKVDWNTTKRLTSNSLLCMSSDGFQSFKFVYVRSARPSPKNDLSCLLEFSAADENDEGYFKLGAVYDIIETTSFYESYRYVLKRLQLFDDENFPLSSPILFLKDCDKKPEYWGKFSYLPDLEFEKNAFQEMMCSRNKQFDEHQHQAFQMALSNQVSMIQGPPGTGKTYLGLQIVKWLVKNASSHVNTPILVICYTNHALDQFLEGILKFTEKVVRIGGQSKSSALEHYHINNIVNALLKKRTEDEPFVPDEEEKSRTIGLKIIGSTVLLQRVGRYTYELKQSEKILQKLEDSLYQLENDPLYSGTILLRILPDILKKEILGWLNSYKGRQTLTKFLIRGMEKWLCVSVSFLHVYEDLPEFLSEIIREILEYTRDNGYLNRNVSKRPENTRENVTSVENKFASSLWKLYLKAKKFASLAVFKIDPRDADDCVQRFLRVHPLDKKTVFKFLEKAASKCLEEINWDAELESKHMWSKGLLERWAMFLAWKSGVRHEIVRSLNTLKNGYLESLEEREKIRFRNNVQLAKHADILGLTTTGAAKHWKLLQEIGPRVVVAEEAAEVLEAHITTALTNATKHLILIGDHKQLRPIPSVYELARRFKLDVSMFERLVANGAPSQCLQTQHRMRPCIAELLVPEIYDNLLNHPSVMEYEDIKGMASNMYFIKHEIHEDGNSDLRSHRNKHEAAFIVSLCRYLLQQGHCEESITILTTYVGQLRLLNEIMARKCLSSVRVTTVDNFQGEENDIILLSFVRSNARNSLGFIEISNRICVALSRARKGLFCIGNFDSFAEKCDSWRKITQKLKKMRLISSALPLKCQNHPKNITLVSRASDFDKVSDGGCTEKCIYRLACGHVCSRKCHPATKGHDEIFCSKKCQQQFQNKNSDSVPLFEIFVDHTSIVKIPRDTDEYSSDSFDYDYESDEYETDNEMHGSDDILTRKENYDAVSTIHFQEDGQESVEFANEGETNEEESVVSDTLVMKNSSGENVDSESYTQTLCTTRKTSGVYDALLENRQELHLVEGRDQITANKLNNVESVNNYFSKESACTFYQGLSSTVSESDTSVAVNGKTKHTSGALESKGKETLVLLDNESEGISGKDEETEPTPQNDVLEELEVSECDKDFSSCECVIEICMKEVLSDTRFGENCSHLKREDENSHLKEQILQRDNFLKILQSECGENIFGSEEVDTSSCGPNVRPEQSFETCDHDKKRKIHCDAMISKKLQCYHEISVPCNEYDLHYDCKVVVDVELPCLHVFSARCRDWMWLKEICCTVNVSILMPCGKCIDFICSEGPYHADCIETVLKCGHRVPCYTDMDKYKCEVPVKCILPCAHEIYVPCTLYCYSNKLAAVTETAPEEGNVQTVLQKLCGKQCNCVMECGHRCLGNCGVCRYDRKHNPCCEIIKRDLPCGHSLQCECQAKDIFCLEKCNVLMACGHRCSGECGSCTTDGMHPKCCELVTRQLSCRHTVKCECSVKDPYCSERCTFLMDCNHRCSGKCGTCIRSEKHPSCSELVKVVLSCGHQLETECHVKNPTCNVQCGVVLSCGHYCSAPCGECLKLHIHAMCTELVNRQLPCGHCVEWPCGSPLPVCDKRCLFGCQHSRCINSCLYPCIKCSKPCDWECEHFTCSMLCCDQCDRPACDVRCPKVLPCGHQCCGYCGEPCPNLCVRCDTVSISNMHDGSNWYVLLEDCNHSIRLDILKAYFAHKSKISCPSCPECGTVITRNKRFGNHIKSWLSSNLLNEKPEMISEVDYDMLEAFVSQIIEKNISLACIPRTVKMCRNMCVLQNITYHSSVSEEHNEEIKSLKKWLSEHSVICSEQQVEESSRAVRRLFIMCYLENVTARGLESELSDYYHAELYALLESKPFGESEEKKVIEVLERNALKDEGKESYIRNLLFFIQHFDSFQSSSRIFSYIR